MRLKTVKQVHDCVSLKFLNAIGIELTGNGQKKLFHLKLFHLLQYLNQTRHFLHLVCSKEPLGCMVYHCLSQIHSFLHLAHRSTGVITSSVNEVEGIVSIEERNTLRANITSFNEENQVIGSDTS